MPNFTQTELVNTVLANTGSLTELEFFGREIAAWKTSPERREMLDGDRYYRGDHDICKRERKIIGESGELEVSKLLVNNRVVDNQYAKHIDQKKNYLLGKPVAFESEDARYADALKTVLGKRFMRTLKNAGLEALNAGISWLYLYYDAGELRTKLFSGHEVLPFWKDGEHTQLDCVARLYAVEVYEGREKKIVEKVEIYKADGVYRYLLEGETLKPDPQATRSDYVTTLDPTGKPETYNWERLPIIPIKYNAAEIPLIRRVRQLQDALNLITSDFVNNMEEDVHSTVLVLKNYDGTNLGEFRRNLAAFGCVKVRSQEGQPGDVDTLTVEVNAENYKAVLETLKKALIENARSYDAKDDRLSGSPNQMNIQSMYSDIDLDANDMETELQAAFEDLLWFVRQHLANTGAGSFEKSDVEVVFNRDILINESEAIENCAKSTGVISDETIVSNHPWTTDKTTELARLKKEREAAEATDPYRQAFETGLTGGVNGNETT